MKRAVMDPQSAPVWIYGTAWKEERTADLVFEALQAGFRAVDTANQRKHYYEEGAGLGIRRFLKLGACSRTELFLQTKFTFANGQDYRKPYNDKDSIRHQVADSFASSLGHLHTDYVDSYVLHGPYRGSGISKEDREAWSAMEEFLDRGQARSLGVSNVSSSQLVELYRSARVKPSFVQNRCYARAGWDKGVREICKKEGIAYQGFSLLTANLYELHSPVVADMAEKYGKTIPQVVFRFCQQLGMICLTGTANPLHMREDLDIRDFELSAEEVSRLEEIGL